MGRFDPKHNADQREAIIRAKTEAGCTAREVVELAAGGLDGLEPFEVSETVVNDLVREERQERGADKPAPPPDATDEVRAVAVATVERIKKLEAPGGKDLSALREAMRTIRECDRQAAKQRLARPADAEPAERSEFTQHLLSLMAEHKKCEEEGLRPCPCSQSCYLNQPQYSNTLVEKRAEAN